MSWFETGFLAGKINSLFNKANYENFFYNQPTTVTGSFQTVLDLTGSGYLDQILTNTQATGTAVRVTIDGVVKILVSTTNANISIGYVNREVITDGGTVMFFAGQRTSTSGHSATYDKIAPYPYSSNGEKIVISPTSILFNTSLKIEIQTGTNVIWCAIGGVK